jgi:hypothetical protein
MGIPGIWGVICRLCPLILLIVPLTTTWEAPWVTGEDTVGQGADAASTDAPAIAVLEPKDTENQSITVVEDKQHNEKISPRYREKRDLTMIVPLCY